MTRLTLRRLVFTTGGTFGVFKINYAPKYLTLEPPAPVLKFGVYRLRKLSPYRHIPGSNTTTDDALLNGWWS